MQNQPILQSKASVSNAEVSKDAGSFVHQTEKIKQPQKSDKEKYMEEITDMFNLAYIPFDVVEDKRAFIEVEKLKFGEVGSDKYERVDSKNEDFNDINQFIRGIIYGSQVVLRKLFVGKDDKKIKVIQRLMNIDELEDDVSVSFIHGICFNYDEKNKIGDESPVYLIREWIKGKSVWRFREDKDNISKADLLSILFSLARILEHYHQYRLSYIFLRPKKVIISSDFTVVLNDIVKINSFVFSEKIKKQFEPSSKDIRDQNRFLHPLLFKIDSLQSNMFDVYQIFDLYSFGCLCYFFYFNKKPWKNYSTYDSIFLAYYGNDHDEKMDIYEFYNKLDKTEREKKIREAFFDYNDIVLLEDDDKTKYDNKLIEIIWKCIWPKYNLEGDGMEKKIIYKYTMKNALQDLLKIDCVQKYKKTKEYDYNFQKDYDNAIEEFQKIFNRVSELNEKNDYDEELKDLLFEF